MCVSSLVSLLSPKCDVPLAFYLLEPALSYFFYFGLFPVFEGKLLDLNTFQFFPIYMGGRNGGERGSGPVTSCLFLFWRMQTICVSQKLVYSHRADSDI